MTLLLLFAYIRIHFCFFCMLHRVAGCPLAAKKRKLLDSSGHESTVAKTRRSEQKRSSSDSSKVSSTETEKKSNTSSANSNSNSNSNSSNVQSGTSDNKRSEKLAGKKDSPVQSSKSNSMVNGIAAGKSVGKDTTDTKERNHRKTTDGASKSKNSRFIFITEKSIIVTILVIYISIGCLKKIKVFKCYLAALSNDSALFLINLLDMCTIFINFICLSKTYKNSLQE